MHKFEFSTHKVCVSVRESESVSEREREWEDRDGESESESESESGSENGIKNGTGNLNGAGTGTEPVSVVVPVWTSKGFGPIDTPAEPEQPNRGGSGLEEMCLPAAASQSLKLCAV